MTRTEQNKSGVIAVTNRARRMNPEIGSYEEHFVDENSGFTVRLNNGAINMSVEIAQDYEVLSWSVSPARIVHVAKTFKKN